VAGVVAPLGCWGGVSFGLGVIGVKGGNDSPGSMGFAEGRKASVVRVVRRGCERDVVVE